MDKFQIITTFLTDGTKVVKRTLGEELASVSFTSQRGRLSWSNEKLMSEEGTGRFIQAITKYGESANQVIYPSGRTHTITEKAMSEKEADSLLKRLISAIVGPENSMNLKGATAEDWLLNYLV